MSRDLPIKPNLDHLKKQAKDLLRELQQRDPHTKLADAQHSLAREYGFESWPKLRSHVNRVHGAALGHPFEATWSWTASDAAAEPYRRVTLQFAVIDDEVTITDIVVDASGREQRNENTVRADGREYPQAHGYAVTARWVDARTLEAVGTKDGRVEGRVTYAVSSDLKMLTLSTVERVLVLHRR
jgi:hypothetical protein